MRFPTRRADASRLKSDCRIPTPGPTVDSHVGDFIFNPVVSLLMEGCFLFIILFYFCKPDYGCQPTLMPLYADLQKHQEMLLQKRIAAFAQSLPVCRHHDGESDKDVSGSARLVRQQLMTHLNKLGVNEKPILCP